MTWFVQGGPKYMFPPYMGIYVIALCEISLLNVIILTFAYIFYISASNSSLDHLFR